MGSLRLLMYYQWRQTKNSLQEPKAKLKVLAVLAVYIFLGIFIGTGFYRFLGIFDETGAYLPGLARSTEATILSLLCLAVFILILTSGLKITYERMFESSDLPFLLSNPISTKTVFAAKFLGSFAYNFLSVAIFILPAWIAYGVKHSAPWWFYLAVVFVILLGALLVHSLISLLILVIMRFVPSGRMKQIFIGLSSLAALFVVFITQMMNNQAFYEQFQDPQLLFEKVGQWGIGQNPYLPHLWMSRFALSFLPAFDYSPWANGLPLLLSTVLLAYLAINLSGSFFLAGYGTKDDQPRQAVKKAKTKARTWWPKQKAMAVVRKELLLVKREPLLWYSLAVITIVLGFFVYNIVSNLQGAPSTETDAAMEQAGLWVFQLLLLLMPTFMGSVLISQLGGLSLSREGKSWWFLRSSPIDPKSLYWGKLFYAAVVPALYCAVFQVVVHRLIPAMTLPLYISVPAVILMNVTIAAVELGMDIFFPDFSIKIEFGGTSGRQAGTMKLMAGMIAGFVAIFVFGGTVSFPLWGEAAFPGLSQGVINGIAVTAFLLETVVLTAVAAALSIRRLNWLMKDERA